MTNLALPYAYAKQWRLAVSARTEHDETEIMHVDELHPTLVAALTEHFGAGLRFRQASPDEHQKALSDIYEKSGEKAEHINAGMADLIDLSGFGEDLADKHDLLEDAEEAPIIQLINAILSEASLAGASDIHIETFEDRVSVRYRVDGVLIDAVNPERELAAMLVSRVKVMARLDIAERRLPQDGRMALQIAGRVLDVRVSTLPTRHGERLVLRLLEKGSRQLTLDQLGQTAHQSELFKQWIREPHGIILVTGPTGSGKSTTLYAALSTLNTGKHNILTVEDPIEVDMDGIGQTQVNQKIDMSFSRGLRAILRQDPDIVMVGEIRDPETAAISVQASLTGHLVLSTLHTNTAAGAIPRLLELGIEPFLLSSSLTGVLAQRLVRKLCTHCAQPQSPNETELQLLASLDSSPTELLRGEGCQHCNHTGYKGRTAIYDFLSIDESMQALIHSGANQQEWQEAARLRGDGLVRDGLQKAAEGITSLEEVMRVTRSAQEAVEK